MVVRSLHGNRDILHAGQVPSPGPRGEGHEVEALGARRQEVGLFHSSDEADEQSRVCGGGAGGAKGRDQGERGPAKHAPDTEPDQRVTCAGTRTAGRARTYQQRPVAPTQPQTMRYTPKGDVELVTKKEILDFHLLPRL